MTDGHKHRHVVVPSWDRWYVRLLRKPLTHETNVDQVDTSPYPYGECERHLGDKPPIDAECWVLTPLGILHRWTGLTLEVKEP